MPNALHFINIRTPNGVFLTQVGVYKSAKYTLLVNDVGDFNLEFPIDEDDSLLYATVGNHIEFVTLVGDVQTISFGGVIQRRQILMDSPISYVTVSGPSWIGYLQRRIVNTNGSAFDSYVSVHADDLLKRVFKNHCGVNAAAPRQLPSFECAAESSVYATLTNYNGRYELVLEALQAICQGVSKSPTLVGDPYELNQLDLFFDVIRISNGNLQFKTFSPQLGDDHSSGGSVPIVFDSNSGNVSSIEYIEDASGVKNYIIGGGTGDGAARLIREGFDSQSILDWGRIEAFLDSSSDATSPVLDLSILKKLAESGRGIKSLTFKINNAGLYQYGVDYKFGDKVTAVYADAGVILTDTIMGCTVNFEAGQLLDVELSISAPNITRLLPGKALANYIAALRRNIGVQARH